MFLIVVVAVFVLFGRFLSGRRVAARCYRRLPLPLRDPHRGRGVSQGPERLHPGKRRHGRAPPVLPYWKSLQNRFSEPSAWLLLQVETGGSVRKVIRSLEYICILYNVSYIYYIYNIYLVYIFTLKACYAMLAFVAGERRKKLTVSVTTVTQISDLLHVGR